MRDDFSEGAKELLAKRVGLAQLESRLPPADKRTSGASHGHSEPQGCGPYFGFVAGGSQVRGGSIFGAAN